LGRAWSLDSGREDIGDSGKLEWLISI
jgi:hypothetical protein